MNSPMLSLNKLSFKENQKNNPIEIKTTQTEPIQKKNGAKLLAFGASALAIAGIATVAIMANKNHKIKSLILGLTSKAESLKNESLEIHQKCEKVVDEILELVKKGKQTDYADILDEAGNVVKKFEVREIDGKKVLQSITETDIKGLNSRISKFSDSELSTITFKNQDGTIDKFTKGTTYTNSVYNKNIELLEDGTIKAEKMLRYNQEGELELATTGFHCTNEREPLGFEECLEMNENNIHMYSFDGKCLDSFNLTTKGAVIPVYENDEIKEYLFYEKLTIREEEPIISAIKLLKYDKNGKLIETVKNPTIKSL